MLELPTNHEGTQVRVTVGTSSYVLHPPPKLIHYGSGLPKEILFLRCGEAEYHNSVTLDDTSMLDSRLTARAIAQARRCHEQLKKQGLVVDVVVASPLRRAMQTAALVRV